MDAEPTAFGSGVFLFAFSGSDYRLRWGGGGLRRGAGSLPLSQERGQVVFVYYSLRGAPAQIYINKAQPGALRHVFINTRGSLPRRIAIIKAAAPPRRTKVSLCNCSVKELKARAPEALSARVRVLKVGWGLQRRGGCAPGCRGSEVGGQTGKGAPA